MDLFCVPSGESYLTLRDAIPLIVQVISSVGIIVAVWLGFKVNVKAMETSLRANIEQTSQQIRSSRVSTNRQEWINSLRLKIAEFVQVAIQIGEQVNQSENNMNSREQTQAFLRQKEALVPAEHRLLLEIELMLNPEKPLHNDLLGKLKDIKDHHRDIEYGRGRVTAALNAAKTLLKQEWERVKDGV